MYTNRKINARETPHSLHTKTHTRMHTQQRSQSQARASDVQGLGRHTQNLRTGTSYTHTQTLPPRIDAHSHPHVYPSSAPLTPTLTCRTLAGDAPQGSSSPTMALRAFSPTGPRPPSLGPREVRVVPGLNEMGGPPSRSLGSDRFTALQHEAVCVPARGLSSWGVSAGSVAVSASKVRPSQQIL